MLRGRGWKPKGNNLKCGAGVHDKSSPKIKRAIVLYNKDVVYSIGAGQISREKALSPFVFERGVSETILLSQDLKWNRPKSSCTKPVHNGQQLQEGNFLANQTRTWHLSEPGKIS